MTQNEKRCKVTDEVSTDEFQSKRIWREVVEVEVMTRRRIRDPPAPNRLVLLVGTTATQIRVIQDVEELCSELRMKLL